MKKLSITCVIAILFCTVFLISQQTSNVLAANICETEDAIRVFIGTTEGLNIEQAQEYIEMQENSLNYLNNNQPNDIGFALVTFDEYLSEQEVNSILQGVSQIKTVYIWTPNEEGRAIIDVQNNNINKTLNDFFDSLDIESASNQDYKDDMQRLISNYGIFAVEVQAEYSILQSMNLQNNICVDLIQSQEAMALSAQTNKPISYICIPQKPDGTA